MDREMAMDIISTAVDIASGGLMDRKIITTPPRKMMTSEQVQMTRLTKESIVNALLKDPRVISAECREGKFNIETKEGTITFNFVFGDEKEGPRFVIDDENIKMKSDTTQDFSHEEYETEVKEFFKQMMEDAKNGMTVEEFIEVMTDDTTLTSVEYKNGTFFCHSAEGTFEFYFPFFKRRSKEIKNES